MMRSWLRSDGSSPKIFFFAVMLLTLLEANPYTCKFDLEALGILAVIGWIASIGPDRSVDPSIEGIRVSPGDYAHHSVQKAFQYGRFQLADERHFAEKRSEERRVGKECR